MAKEFVKAEVVAPKETVATKTANVVTDIVTTYTVDPVSGAETQTITYLTKDGKIVKTESK